VFGLFLTLVASSSALAVCGDLSGDETITANDALTALRTAVGVPRAIVCSCLDCADATVSRAPRHCADVNGDAQMTTFDALTILKLAVGEDTPVSCSCEPCQQPTATTTTLPLCMEEDALDGRVYIVKRRCTSRFDCTVTLLRNTIEFRHLGEGRYELLNVPDGELIDTGGFDCMRFKTDTPPVAAWTFPTSIDLRQFSGSVGFSAPYFGSCSTTGALAPTEPPTPSAIRCTPR
jgi:hypothetical protein